MAVDRDCFLNRYEAMQAEAGMTDHVRGSGDPAATMKAFNRHANGG